MNNTTEWARTVFDSALAMFDNPPETDEDFTWYLVGHKKSTRRSRRGGKQTPETKEAAINRVKNTVIRL